MRSLRVKLAIGVAALGVVVVAAAAVAGDGGKIDTSLTGFEEVPAIVTKGEGSFKARLSHSGQELRYELRYSGLEGGNTPTQAHIHIAQESVNGGISVWLCGSPTNPGPAGTPACLAQPATIRGTITPAGVVGPGEQGIAPGEFEDLVRALRAGVAYANVHTATFPGGEILGQLDDDRDHDDKD